MLRLRSMGECVIEVGPTRLTPDLDVLFATSLYLILERGREVLRSELTELVWPTATRINANHCLRQTLYRLRSLGLPMEATRSAVRLPAELVAADCWRVTRAAPGQPTEDLIELAVSVFLPGYAPTCSPAFAEWVELQRNLVTAAARRLLIQEIERAQRESDWAAAECFARACLRIDPLNEAAVLALAEALARHGSKVEALRVLDQYVGEIGSEAGVSLHLPASVLRGRIAERIGGGGPVPVDDLPLFGRRDDVGLVDQTLQRACDGLGSTVLFWGEPGIGKTRLLSELCMAASIRGFAVAQTTVRWNDEQRPFAAFADLTPRLIELPGALGTSPESLGYLRRLNTSTLNSATPSQEAHHFRALYSRLRSSLLDLLDSISSEVPLVITIDDCQWLDEASTDVCAAVADLAQHRRVVLLLASRQDALGSRRVLPQQSLSHRLLPLSDQESAELVRHVMSTAGIPRPIDFPRWCARFGNGNPLLLLELALRAVERPGGLQPPPNLRAMLASRILHLPFCARRLLEAIALLGRFSTLERVEPLFDRQSADLLNGLSTLEEHGLVRPCADRLCVRHDLVAEITLANLTPGVRTVFHRKIAGILSTEALQTQSAELTWEAARHWTGAGDTSAAVHILRACARHCLELGAPQRAIDLLREALLSKTTDAVYADLERELAQAFWIAGRWDDVRSTTEAMLRRLGDEQQDHSDIELMHLQSSFRAGRDLPGTLTGLLRCVNSRARAAHRAQAAVAALMIADNALDHDTAQQCFEVVERIALEEEIDDSSHLVALTVYHTSFGDIDKAVVVASKLVATSRSANQSFELYDALRIASMPLFFSGDQDGARRAAEEAYGIVVSNGATGCQAQAANHLAWLALFRDDLTTAEEWLRRSRKHAGHQPATLSNLFVNAAELAWRLGDATKGLADLTIASTQQEIGGALRGRLRSIGLRTLLYVQAGKSECARSDLEELIIHYKTVRRFRDQDLVIAAIVSGQDARGNQQDASAVLTDYFGYRALDKSALSPTLLRVLANRGSSSIDFQHLVQSNFHPSSASGLHSASNEPCR